ncbi:SPOSA6832_04404, partial [Sporobolomyces salmonicolor]
MVANKLNEQKRQHRERAQPLQRQKLGLLEKHADYVKRARDFHSKEQRIQTLREKASMRNKDEFYFAMIRNKTKGGVHIQSRGNEPLPVDLVKVLKTQDAGYIRTQLAMEQSQQLDSLVDTAVASSSKVKKGSNEEDDMMDDWDMSDDDEPVASTSSGTGVKRNHIVFSEDLEKRSTPSSLPAASTSASISASAAVRKRSKGKGKAVAAEEAELRAQREKDEEEIAEEAEKHREHLTAELAARQTRLVQLHRAMRELELQRLLMGKGAKSQIVKAKGDGKAKEEEWWLAGGKPGKGGKKGQEEEERGSLPMAEEGIATGARVWKWKAERKR